MVATVAAASRKDQSRLKVPTGERIQRAKLEGRLSTGALGRGGGGGDGKSALPEEAGATN